MNRGESKTLKIVFAVLIAVAVICAVTFIILVIFKNADRKNPTERVRQTVESKQQEHQSATSAASSEPSQTQTPTQTTPFVDASTELERKIESIRDRYYAFQDRKSSLTKLNFGTSAEAYYLHGELQGMLEYPGWQDDEQKERADSTDLVFCSDKFWYYDSGEVYFIFMVNRKSNDEYRLYFDEGTLIRWIGPDGVVHDDYGNGWDKMQGYYDYALSQCESVADYSKYQVP